MRSSARRTLAFMPRRVSRVSGRVPSFARPAGRAAPSAPARPEPRSVMDARLRCPTAVCPPDRAKRVSRGLQQETRVAGKARRAPSESRSWICPGPRRKQGGRHGMHNRDGAYANPVGAPAPEFLQADCGRDRTIEMSPNRSPRSNRSESRRDRPGHGSRVRGSGARESESSDRTAARSRAMLSSAAVEICCAHDDPHGNAPTGDG
jgi:hypothetical protein